VGASGKVGTTIGVHVGVALGVPVEVAFGVRIVAWAVATAA